MRGGSANKAIEIWPMPNCSNQSRRFIKEAELDLDSLESEAFFFVKEL